MESYNLILNEKYKHLEDFIKDLPSSFMESGEVVYSGRNLIKIFEVKGLTLNVKSFKKPFLINQIAYSTFRKSKAKRSFIYASLLKEKDFETPDPVAFIEFRKFGLLKKAYYVSLHEEFDGMLRELIKGSLSDHQELIQQFANYTAQLHESQILHLDYSPGNILYKKENNKYIFYLVDLNRMRFNKSVGLDKGCFNFRRLWGSNEMLTLLAKEYAKARRMDESKCIEKTLKYHKQFWKNYCKKRPDASPYRG